MLYLLPPMNKGFLPLFLFYCGISALLTAIDCFRHEPTTALAHFRGEEAPPASALLTRVYSLTNTYNALLYIALAYNVDEWAIYDLAMVTFFGTAVWCALEVFVYKTIRVKDGIRALATAVVGLVWLVVARQSYVRSSNYEGVPYLGEPYNGDGSFEDHYRP